MEVNFEGLLGAKGLEEFRAALLTQTQVLGFNTFSAATYFYKADGSFEMTLVDNTPPEFMPVYDNKELQQSDPVMQHCKVSSLPMEWSRKTYIDDGQAEVHDQMRACGYESGVCSAIHLPGGVHFVLGFDSKNQLPMSVSDRRAMVASVQMLAVYAQDVAVRLFKPKDRISEDVRLSVREIEVLKWTMAGKTAWETGMILNISERTVGVHAGNAIRKLGVVSKHQAVLKALDLKLIM